MINPDMKLTRNFRLREFLHSETAERREDLFEAQMTPSDNVIANLTYLCTTVLQPLRETFSYPISISSGYRSEKLNKTVGGSHSSQHLIGQAADLQLSSQFLSDEYTIPLREQIADRINGHTGMSLRDGINANFYLFAYICLRIDQFDVDQVIHEYGAEYGQPAWVHVAAAPAPRDKRQILVIGRYNGARHKKVLRMAQALSLGTQEVGTAFV